MDRQKTITILILAITLLSGISAATGMFSDSGSGTFEYESIRGETVEIYGRGIYRHMSADVAVQGIAQDVVTFFIAIPLLWVSLFKARRGDLKGRFLLAGTLGYFLVSYLFYLVMGMYNILFLVYAALLCLSFFAFFLVMISFNPDQLPGRFSDKNPARFAGGFLLLNCSAITLLWLEIVVPPLLNGSIYPVQLQHYTTLIVQGLDLGLLLPIGFVSGVLLIKKRPFGYLAGTVYLVFLTILMAALISKIIAMGMAGETIIPAVFIIPALFLIAFLSTAGMLRSISADRSDQMRG